MDALTGWMFVTRWGNAVLLLPVSAGIGIDLWVHGERRVARRWAAVFGGAVLVVLATKLAFLGWGIGSHALDFTGISGHGTLAAAVLPMLAWWLTRERSVVARCGAVLGAWVLAAAIGVSRVWLSAHSISEVVAGFALGTGVAWTAIPRQSFAGHRGVFRWAVFGALLIAGLQRPVGESEEAHGIIVRLALCLSGRTAPFTRETF